MSTKSWDNKVWEQEHQTYTESRYLYRLCSKEKLADFCELPSYSFRLTKSGNKFFNVFIEVSTVKNNYSG